MQRLRALTRDLAGVARRVLAPRARRPIGGRAWGALAAFLTLFTALVIGLEAGGLVLFTRPWGFALMALAPWLWWVGMAGGAGGLVGARCALAISSRLLLLGLLAALLSEPRMVRSSDRLAVIYVVDVSNSVPQRWRRDSLGWVVRSSVSKAKRPGDVIGLVVFGRDAAVELPPRETFPFSGLDDAYVTSEVDAEATDLGQALTMAAAMLPEGMTGRLVLISDGVDTEGSLESAIEELRGRGVTVDVLETPYDYGAEVWVERIELPPRVKQGEPYEASVLINATEAGEGVLRLRENGELIGEQRVRYQKGKNRIRLKLTVRHPGVYEYEARLKPAPGADHREENNVARGHLYLRGRGKVLLINNPTGEERDWQPLTQALAQSKRACDLMPSHAVPREGLSLLPYDLIILCNTPADQLDPLQMRAIRDAVYEQGSGLLMIGGPDSYGPGGYHQTVIETALPVDMDVSHKKVLPKSALAIVLHTCEFPQGNTWGKRITKQAIKVLGAQDDVGVLVFDQNGYRWLFELQPAKNLPQLVPLINKAQIGDMPDFASTMKLGLKGLKANDAAAKHMIIISDGDPSPPPKALLDGYKAAKISISTVTIHPHGGADTAIMKKISQMTGGRHYFPKTSNKLPSIFIREAKTLKRSMIQPGIFTPVNEGPSLVLKGIESLPSLKAFVLTTPKNHPTVNVVLRHPKQEGGISDPVLAVWRYGLGKSAAWTSDLGTNWAANWTTWKQYRQFVNQLVTDISRVEKATYLRVNATARGGKALIEVDDSHPAGEFLQLEARVAGPGNKSETVPLEPIGPRRYRASLPLWGTGRYQIAVSGSGGDRQETAFAGMAIPYSPEYLRFRSDPLALASVAEGTEGRVLGEQKDDGDRVFDRPSKPRRSSLPITIELLILLAIWLVADVALRRVQIDGLAILRWLRREGESSQTMSTLLAAKQRAGERQGGPPQAGGEGPPQAELPAGAPIPTAKPKPTVSKTDADEGPTSTTAHLLALKKKRKKE